MSQIESLQALIKSGNIPPILLLFGEENFLLEEDYNSLLLHLLPTDESKFDFEVIDASESDFNRIVDSCSSYPFVNSHRVVVVNNFDVLADKHSKKDGQHTGFQKYMDNPTSSTCLIIKAELDSLFGVSADLKNKKQEAKAKKKLDSLKFPFLTLINKHSWIEYPKVSQGNISAWVKDRFKSFDKTIDTMAAEFLIANSDLVLRNLAEEINKVILYIGDNKNVTADDMAESIGKSRHYNVFELQKAVGARNLALAITILQNMLATEKQEILIVTMISRYFISLWKLIEAQQDSSNQFDLAGKIGISPYFVAEYQEAARRYTSNEINRAIKLLTEVDYKLKSTSIPALFLLEKLFIGIMEK